MLHLVRHRGLIDQETRQRAYVARIPKVTSTEAMRTLFTWVYADFQTPAPAVRVPALPDELIAQIVYSIDTITFDHTTNEWVEPEGPPYRALWACALTSRAFLPAARERMYRTVTIHVKGPDCLVWAKVLPRTINLSTFPEELLFTTSSKQLQQTLAYSPHIAALVEEVFIIYPDRPAGVHVLKAGRSALSIVLSACGVVSVVKILTVHDAADLTFEESAEIIAPLETTSSLRHLTLDTLDLQDEATARSAILLLSHHQSTLKELDISETYWNDAHVDLFLDVSLDTLQLDVLAFSLYGGSVPLFNFLTAASCQSLKKLTLAMRPHTPGLDLAVFSSLECLTWTLAMPHNGPMEGEA